jgi:putative endopeptidase
MRRGTCEDTKRYTERAQRAVTQYGAYEGPEGTKLNGQLTLGENLADVGGLKIAYDALQRALAKKPEGVVDGFTPEQRFFIAFAQDWRLVMRPEFERTLIMTDPHSLARYRVKGPIRQLPEFAKAFSCDVRHALLPEDQRTNLW